MLSLNNSAAACAANPPVTGLVIAFAAAIFLGCLVHGPSLLDDVDAANASIARTMLESGDWVTARLNGVPYLEKAPLHQWLIAVSYMAFGVHDWAARVPLAVCVVLLCWTTTRFGNWAFGHPAGFYSGLVLATCVGLFLFTRVLIADGLLTLTTTAALWAFLRALDSEEPNPRRWALLSAASLGAGFLTKALIALVLPLGAALLYLTCTRQLFAADTWRRLHLLSGSLVLVLMAAPWLVLAILRNPPYFDFSLGGGPGQYNGFFWLFFINEHLLRFLNLRYPRDYDTVPRVYFWLLHLVWLFPWSVFLPAATRLPYRPADRAGRTRILALCWVGFLLAFFSFSTTQEYYSMPLYPALALLLGSSLASENRWVRRGSFGLVLIFVAALVSVVVLLVATWNIPTPGDISTALVQNPEAYKLSLGHLGDLTVRSFAYLRQPLLLAGLAFLLGAIAVSCLRGPRSYLGLALIMCLFAHAATLAMRRFDPYLSSRPLAEALLHEPPGRLIVYDEYYAFSSVFFYAGCQALLVNGRINDLE